MKEKTFRLHKTNRIGSVVSRIWWARDIDGLECTVTFEPAETRPEESPSMPDSRWDYWNQEEIFDLIKAATVAHEDIKNFKYGVEATRQAMEERRRTKG